MFFFSKKTKRDEEINNQNDDIYYQLFQNAPMCMNIVGLKDGVILEVNKKYIEKMGYSREELIGKRIESLKIWNKKQEVNEYLRLIKTVGECHNFEAEMKTKSGKIARGFISSIIVKYKGESAVYSMGEDITAEHELKTRLASQQEELEKLNRFMVGRENKMIDLKDEIEELKKKSKG